MSNLPALPGTYSLLECVPALPGTYSLLECVQQSSDFVQATLVKTLPTSSLLDQLTKSPTSILIKTAYLGINASDINLVRGSYDPSMKPPYPCGFEAIGTVYRIGSLVKSVHVGEIVCCMLSGGAFTEYLLVPEPIVLTLPHLSQPQPEYLGIMVNGLTAWLALHKAAHLGPKDTVLVTGAMGATGQIAVQVAKLHGCTVVGTCGSDEKATQLKNLGLDRCINYRKEDVHQVLKTEFPKGFNVIFEGIGGSMLKTAFRNLAPRGRLLIIGAVSCYTNTGLLHQIWNDTLPTFDLLSKSTSAIGFFLGHYSAEYVEAWTWLLKHFAENKLKIAVDPTKFSGLNQINLALNHLLQGNNIGKVVVDMRNILSNL